MPDADGRTWVHDLLEELVTAIAAESFPARRNDGCDTCPVRRCCPARPEGGAGGVSQSQEWLTW